MADADAFQLAALAKIPLADATLRLFDFVLVCAFEPLRVCGDGGDSFAIRHRRKYQSHRDSRGGGLRQHTVVPIDREKYSKTKPYYTKKHV